MGKAIARLKDARLSAQKARLVVNLIRGVSVENALKILTFNTKKAAYIIKKILESVIANAEHNEGLNVDDLIITKIFVDEASSQKRSKTRAKGRSNRIIKRNCHITIEIADKN